MLPTPAVISHIPPLTSPQTISSTKSSQWAQAYNLWLNSRTSPHTRRAYASAWSSFQEHSGKLPWEITRADIARWLDAQRAAGLSASTINQRLAALSSFFTYASDVYQVTPSVAGDSPLTPNNPAHSIPRLKTRSYTKSRYLSVEEARALLRAIPRHTTQGLRDYALFLTYLVTGRRNSEIRKLQYGDFEFDFSNSSTKELMSLRGHHPEAISPTEGREFNPQSPISNVFYRWSGKGKSRRDQCPQIVWESIQNFLCAADKLPGILPDAYIFTPLTDRAARLPNVDPARWTRNRPLSSREVGRLLKKYARRAGLNPSKIRVHTLRHTAAMLRKQAGDDIDQISSFLGHSSLSTTQIYLHRLSGQSDSSWLRVAELLGL